MDTKTTGKLGIRLTFYAALAFGLALFSQVLGILLLLGFVLVVEKDEWTARQCIQALLLTLLGYVISIVQSLISGLSNFFSYTTSSYFYDAIGYYGYETDFWTVSAILLGILGVLLSLYVMVWSIAGILRTVKGREAEIPLVHKWAWAVYNKVAPQPVFEDTQDPPFADNPKQEPEKPSKETPEDFYNGFKPDEKE